MLRLLASLALLFCLTSTTLCAQDLEVPPATEATLVLHAPQSCRIGELVRFDVSESIADSFRWLLVPDSITDFLVYDEGQRAVFSARAAGEYRFIVACAKGGTVDVVTIVVRCIGPPAQPTTDSLAKWIPFWLWATPMPQDQCEALAAGFEDLASRKTEFEDSGEWIKATAKNNREILGDNLEAWKPMLDKIGAVLVKKAQSGELSTPEDHAQIWLEVAEGLRDR